MQKTEFTKAMTRVGYGRNEISVAVRDIFQMIALALCRGEDVRILDFGAFEVRKHKGRKRFSFTNGGLENGDDYLWVKFTPSSNLTEAVRTGNSSRYEFDVDIDFHPPKEEEDIFKQ